MVNEFKRELSKITGIDMFNPKFRELFKKYFPDEVKEDEEVEEENEEINEAPVEEAKVEDIEKTEDEKEINEIEEDKAENVETEEEKAEEVNEESEEIEKEVEEVKSEEAPTDDLLDAKIELELVKNNVKPERLEAVKNYAKFLIKSVDDLGKVSEILKEYPEWKQGYKVENIGMPVNEDNEALTEEEKRLKQMGIDPRN